MARGDEKGLIALEAELDKEAAKLWGITAGEMRGIADSLMNIKIMRKGGGSQQGPDQEDE